MNKNVPYKNFYQTTIFAENAINGANMRCCHIEFSNKQKHRQQRHYQRTRCVYHWTALISVLIKKSCGDLQMREFTAIP